MSNDFRLDLLIDAIARSGLDNPTKDALADDLKYVQDINASADTASQGIKRLLISGVRRELIAHQRITEAIAVHASTCRQIHPDAKTAAVASVSPTPKTVKEAIMLHFRVVFISLSLVTGTAIITHQLPELFDLIFNLTTKVSR